MNRWISFPGKRTLEEFETLALPLMDKLHFTALKLTRDKFDAEDLVQNTYLRAWSFYYQFESGSNFEGWIFRILTNNFINEYRRKKRAPVREDFDIAESLIPARDNPDDRKQNEIMNFDDKFDDTVTAALDKLPDHYRIVVLLADVSELKYKEIAQAIDCPIGTVMSRLNRGRKMLAKQLKDYAIEGGFITG